MSKDTTKDRDPMFDKLSAVARIQSRVTSELSGLLGLSDLDRAAVLAESEFFGETGCSRIDARISIDIGSPVRHLHAEHWKPDEIWFDGNVGIDAENVTLVVRRKFRDGDTRQITDHYEPHKADVLCDEWPTYRTLLLQMITQADRLLGLLPVVMPVTTLPPAAASPAPMVPPSRPARSGRANRGRRVASSRSRGG